MHGDGFPDSDQYDRRHDVAFSADCFTIWGSEEIMRLSSALPLLISRLAGGGLYIKFSCHVAGGSAIVLGQ